MSQKSTAGLSRRDRFMQYAAQKTQREERLCEVGQFADMARWAYDLRESAAVSVSVSVIGGWKKVDQRVDKVTGLKAGLFVYPQTNEFAMFFAGTEDFDHARALLNEQLPNFHEKLALCLAHSAECTQLSYAWQAQKFYDRPIESVLSAAAKVDPKKLLAEEAVRNYLYAAIGLAFGAAPDTYADTNIAFPRMDARGRALFDKSLSLFDEWSASTKGGRYGTKSAQGISIVGGHSLGGAMAQVVGLSKQVATITFNSAPVPLDPEFRRMTGYGQNRDDILHVRAIDDPLSRVVFAIQRDNELKAWIATILKELYVLRGNSLDSALEAQYESVLGRNQFYAGNNWLVNIQPTGHAIAALAEQLRVGCNGSNTISDNFSGATSNITKPATPLVRNLIGTDGFPSLPFVERDPWDVDRSIGTWKLKANAVLVQDVKSPTTIARIAAGTCVVADSMEFHNSRYQLWEIRRPQQIELWNWVDGEGLVTTKRSVRKGDRIAVLRYFGEGECVVWFQGRTHVTYCPEVMESDAAGDLVTGDIPAPDIWAHVRTRDGSVGWIKNPDAEGLGKHDSEPGCLNEKWITTGRWQGTVKQGGQTYPVSMTIEDLLSIGSIAGKIDYPSLHCGGSIKVKSVEGRSRVVVDERLEFGRDRCVDRGTIQLDFRGSTVDWQWMYPDGRVGANATLSR